LSEEHWWKWRESGSPPEWRAVCSLVLSAAEEAGDSLQTSACTLFSWNQSGFRELLVPFWQLAIPVVIDLTWLYPMAYLPEYPHQTCSSPLGPRCSRRETWARETGTLQMVSVQVWLGVWAVRTPKTHFLLQQKSTQELLSYRLCTLALWVEGRNCAGQEKPYFDVVTSIYMKSFNLYSCACSVFICFTWLTFNSSWGIIPEALQCCSTVLVASAVFLLATMVIFSVTERGHFIAPVS